MKREYSKPAMNVEVFEASEYVAACYKINCNIPGEGDLYEESNGQPGLQTGTGGDRKLLNDVVACNEWHKGVIQNKDPQSNGYWRYKNSLFGSTKVIPVYWWKEDLNSTFDIHATRMDGFKEWETNPNAS